MSLEIVRLVARTAIGRFAVHRGCAAAAAINPVSAVSRTGRVDNAIGAFPAKEVVRRDRPTPAIGEVNDGVAYGPAIHGVRATAGFNKVASASAKDGVGPCGEDVNVVRLIPAVNKVRSAAVNVNPIPVAPARDVIIPTTVVDRVFTRVPSDVVIATTIGIAAVAVSGRPDKASSERMNVVVPVPPNDLIIPGIIPQRIVAISAIDVVVARRGVLVEKGIFLARVVSFDFGFPYDIPMTKALRAASAEETKEWGRKLAHLLFPGAVIGLEGELGAGKTCFVKGLASGLGLDEDEIASPTFTLIAEHYRGRIPLYHIDLYRVAGAEVEELGIDEYLYGQGVTAIEWFQFLPAEVVTEYLRILFVITEDEERLLEVSAQGERYERIVQTLDAWNQ